MEYDVYGNVFRKTYIKKHDIKLLDDIWEYNLDLLEYNDPTKLYSILVNQREPLIRQVDSYYIRDSIWYKRNKLRRSYLRKIYKKEYNSKSFVKYKLIKTIDTSREFKDDDLFTYSNNDYKATYKYNSDKDRHELYINYLCELIIDDKIDNTIDKLIEETNKLIEEHNDKIDKQIKELEENSKKIENKSWFTKLINKIKGVK